jgi:hypothetical protein
MCQLTELSLYLSRLFDSGKVSRCVEDPHLLNSMRIQIQLLKSLRIRIQGAKCRQMRIRILVTFFYHKRMKNIL